MSALIEDIDIGGRGHAAINLRPMSRCGLMINR
jgi:hypothetical protein